MTILDHYLAACNALRRGDNYDHLNHLANRALSQFHPYLDRALISLHTFTRTGGLRIPTSNPTPESSDVDHEESMPSIVNTCVEIQSKAPGNWSYVTFPLPSNPGAPLTTDLRLFVIKVHPALALCDGRSQRLDPLAISPGP